MEARDARILKGNRIAIVQAIRLFFSERFAKVTRDTAFPELNTQATRDAIYHWAWEELASDAIPAHGKQAASKWLQDWVADWIHRTQSGAKG